MESKPKRRYKFPQMKRDAKLEYIADKNKRQIVRQALQKEIIQEAMEYAIETRDYVQIKMPGLYFDSREAGMTSDRYGEPSSILPRTSTTPQPRPESQSGESRPESQPDESRPALRRYKFPKMKGDAKHAYIADKNKRQIKAQTGMKEIIQEAMDYAIETREYVHLEMPGLYFDSREAGMTSDRYGEPSTVLPGTPSAPQPRPESQPGGSRPESQPGGSRPESQPGGSRSALCPTWSKRTSVKVQRRKFRRMAQRLSVPR